jgi:hypothetical protein
MDKMQVYIKDTVAKKKGIYTKVPTLPITRFSGSHGFVKLEEKHEAMSPFRKFERAQLLRPGGAMKYIEYPGNLIALSLIKRPEFMFSITTRADLITLASQTPLQ